MRGHLIAASPLQPLGYLRVNVHVLLQTDGVAEGFPADAAPKGPHSAVGPPDVNLQAVRRGEHLNTRRRASVMMRPRFFHAKRDFSSTKRKESSNKSFYFENKENSPPW